MADLGLGMLVFVAVGTAVSANLGGTAVTPPLAAYAFGGFLGALMLVRRRRPTATLLLTAAALIAYYMLDLPPVGLAVPVAAALYSAAEQGRLSWAIGTACGLLAVSTVVRLRQGDDPSFVLGYEFASASVLMAAVIALGDSVRARRGWRAELVKQARAAELEREREATIRTEQERLRIARDLHDVLAHTVSVISLHSDVARESLRDDPATAERSLAAVREVCSDMVRDLRATVGALRASDGGEPAPGLARLDALTSTAEAAGLTVRVQAVGTSSPLPAITDATAYRIVQEALSNVLRHAEAESVDIVLGYRPEVLLLQIRDDGRGATGESSGSRGWGINGMQERLKLLGGSLRTESPPDGGFLVEARIPREESA